jgi:hypothetical protein
MRAAARTKDVGPMRHCHHWPRTWASGRGSGLPGAEVTAISMADECIKAAVMNERQVSSGGC